MPDLIRNKSWIAPASIHINQQESRRVFGNRDVLVIRCVFALRDVEFTGFIPQLLDFVFQKDPRLGSRQTADLFPKPVANSASDCTDLSVRVNRDVQNALQARPITVSPSG